MPPFATSQLPVHPAAKAPDGTDVRPLLQLDGGSLAHFELPARGVSRAVQHRTVEEIWYCLRGEGEMWREQRGREEIVPMAPGVALTIPLGTRFQLRSLSDEPLTMVAITMPPWPGEGEALLVAGKWPSAGERGASAP